MVIHFVKEKCLFLASPETGDLYYTYDGWSYDGIKGKVYEIGDKYYYVRGVSYNVPDDCKEIGQDTFFYCCSKSGRLYCRNPNMVDAGAGRTYYYRLRLVPCQRQAREEYETVMNSFREVQKKLLKGIEGLGTLESKP